jgi:hypothetical protein
VGSYIPEAYEHACLTVSVPCLTLFQHHISLRLLYVIAKCSFAMLPSYGEAGTYPLLNNNKYNNRNPLFFLSFTHAERCRTATLLDAWKDPTPLRPDARAGQTSMVR